MKRIWQAGAALAAAAALAPAAAFADTPPQYPVDEITPGYFDPVPEVPTQSGVLGAQFTLRAVEARGSVAGAGVTMRVTGTGRDATLAYVDRAAGVALSSPLVVSLRLGKGAATITGVAQQAGKLVSFTIRTIAGGKGRAGTF